MHALSVRPRRVFAFTLAATVLWPLQEYTGGILIRDHHAAQVVGLRYIAHLLLLSAWVLPSRGLRGFATARPALQLLRGVCMFGMPASWMLATRFASGQWIWTIFWSLPLLALIGAAVVCGERPGIRVWLATAIGAAGVAVILQASPSGPLGTVIALGMSGSVAGYLVLSRVLRDEPLGASLFYTGLGALLPMLPFLPRVWTAVTVSDILPALFTGVISILILASFDVAAEAGPLAFVAPLLPLVPVWELVLGATMHGRSVSGPSAAGAVIVVAAAVAGAAFTMRNGLTERSADMFRRAASRRRLDPRPTPGAGGV